MSQYMYVKVAGVRNQFYPHGYHLVDNECINSDAEIAVGNHVHLTTNTNYVEPEIAGKVGIIMGLRPACEVEGFDNNCANCENKGDCLLKK